MCAPIAAAVLLYACSRDIQNADAVRAGIIDYLRENQSKIGLNVDAMQIDVTSVSFQKDEARATVAFRVKNGGDGTPMMIGYTLDRKGNKWVVRPGAQSSGNPHGASAPSGETPQLPPGHPATGTNPNPPQGQLPAGHPPVGSKEPGSKQ